MQAMIAKGASGKTIANKHGFLSSALTTAVRAGRITTNPAAGQRAPTCERKDVVCLSREDFVRLRDRHRAVASTHRVPRRLRMPVERGHRAEAV
jgi:site-specific recombinase XerC